MPKSKRKTPAEKREKQRQRYAKQHPQQVPTLYGLCFQLYTMIINSRLAMGASGITVLLLAFMAFQYLESLFGIQPESSFKPMYYDALTESADSPSNQTYFIPPGLVLRPADILSEALNIIFGEMTHAFQHLKTDAVPSQLNVLGTDVEVYTPACFGGEGGQFDEETNTLLMCAYVAAKQSSPAVMSQIACLAWLNATQHIAYPLTLLARQAPKTWQALCRMTSCTASGRRVVMPLASIIQNIQLWRQNGTAYEHALEEGHVIPVEGNDMHEVGDEIEDAYGRATECLTHGG